jgi:hypothetical protein
VCARDWIDPLGSKGSQRADKIGLELESFSIYFFRKKYVTGSRKLPTTGRCLYSAQVKGEKRKSEKRKGR